MPITLTTPFTIANGTRLVVASAKPDDDAQSFVVTYELRTPPASDLVLSTQTIVIRNGNSDKISRNASPAAGSSVQSLLVFTNQGAVTPTGYTDAINAWRAATTAAGRKNALDAVGLASGWIDSSLAGT